MAAVVAAWALWGFGTGAERAGTDGNATTPRAPLAAHVPQRGRHAVAPRACEPHALRCACVRACCGQLGPATSVAATPFEFAAQRCFEVGLAHLDPPSGLRAKGQENPNRRLRLTAAWRSSRIGLTKPVSPIARHVLGRPHRVDLRSHWVILCYTLLVCAGVFPVWFACVRLETVVKQINSSHDYSYNAIKTI